MSLNCWGRQRQNLTMSFLWVSRIFCMRSSQTSLLACKTVAALINDCKMVLWFGLSTFLQPHLLFLLGGIQGWCQAEKKCFVPDANTTGTNEHIAQLHSSMLSHPLVQNRKWGMRSEVWIEMWTKPNMGIALSRGTTKIAWKFSCCVLSNNGIKPVMKHEIISVLFMLGLHWTVHKIFLS